uniref:Non-structural maintenance of chromosomes element 1 homolog n=1 Tax=Phallusia mammillata TaxID=59560 RepID=A0A6F9DMU5_9ASCI|nr:non-structural maintenance of chromosomes element 1 homolog [Phallusia mammillata]
MGTYRKCHIYFLQAIMNRGSFSETDCEKACAECCRLSDVDFSGDVQNFIRIINEKIHVFHLKIREGKREDNGEMMYILASQVESDLNRLVVGGDFTRGELEFFRRILELIVHSDTPPDVGTISSVDVLNMADSLNPKITKADAKKLLSRYVDDGWFFDKNGVISMSPRTIVELELYLTEAFHGLLHNCNMCSLIVFQGKCCLNCSVRMHHFCAHRYFAGMDRPKCMSCGSLWNAESDIVTVFDNDDASEAQTNQRSFRSRKRPRIN